MVTGRRDVPRGKFRHPWLRAFSARKRALARMASRAELIVRKSQALEFWGTVFVEKLELGGLLTGLFEERNFATNNNLASAWWVNRRGGLGGVFQAVRRKERTVSGYQFTFSASPSFLQRIRGRLVIAGISHVPLLRALPGLVTSARRVYKERMCPCGQHVLDYGLCLNFEVVRTRHVLEYVVELLVGYRLNGDAEILLPMLACAREYAVTMQRSYKGNSVNITRTILKAIPGMGILSNALAMADASLYVISGHTLGVASAPLRLTQYITRITWTDLDELMWLVWTGHHGRALYFERFEHVPTPFSRMDRYSRFRNYVLGCLPKLFKDAFTKLELAQYIDTVPPGFNVVSRRPSQMFSEWVAAKRAVVVPLPNVIAEVPRFTYQREAIRRRTAMSGGGKYDSKGNLNPNWKG